MNRLALVITAALAGCCSPSLITPPPTGTPADAMLTVDPGTVTPADLQDSVGRVAKHYWDYAQWQGVCLEPFRSDPSLAEPDGFGNGGDSALFTGFALAAHTLWAKQGSPEAHERALRSLRGLWYLTNAAGPGVISRVALPLADADKFRYPESWKKRPQSFVGEVASVPGPPLPGTLADDFGPTAYYSRATKDQLTGIVFGLTVAWLHLPEGRPAVREMTSRLVAHLERYSWFIRDQKGENDTNADKVDGMLRLALLALWRKTSSDPAVEARYLDEFAAGDAGDWFNGFTNISQYYAHNLRAARSFGIWLLEDDPGRKQEMADYFHDKVWAHTAGHQNAWLATIKAVQSSGSERTKVQSIALRSLASLSLKPIRRWPSPYGGQQHEPGVLSHLFGCADEWVLPPHQRKSTEYWTWQKAPWDVGGASPDAAKPPHGDDTGLSLLLPYWLLKAYH